MAGVVASLVVCCLYDVSGCVLLVLEGRVEVERCGEWEEGGWWDVLGVCCVGCCGSENAVCVSYDLGVPPVVVVAVGVCRTYL